MMSPVFLGLKEKFPGYDIHLITDSGYIDGALIEMARRNPYIDVIHDIPLLEATTTTTVLIQGLGDKAPSMGLHEHDVVLGAAGAIDLNNECVMYEHSDNPAKHRTDIWCYKAGVKPSSCKPIYRTTKRERAWADEQWERCDWRGMRNIGVAMTAVAGSRAFSGRVTHDLLRALVDTGYHPITVDVGMKVAEYDFICATTLEQTFALVEKLDGFISPDTGLLHIAGTMGVPLVGVFGSVPSAMRIKYYDKAVGIDTEMPCGGCWYNHVCETATDPLEHYACMKTVDVEGVVEAIKGLVPV